MKKIALLTAFFASASCGPNNPQTKESEAKIIYSKDGQDSLQIIKPKKDVDSHFVEYCSKEVEDSILKEKKCTILGRELTEDGEVIHTGELKKSDFSELLILLEDREARHLNDHSNNKWAAFWSFAAGAGLRILPIGKKLAPLKKALSNAAIYVGVGFGAAASRDSLSLTESTRVVIREVEDMQKYNFNRTQNEVYKWQLNGIKKAYHKLLINYQEIKQKGGKVERVSEKNKLVEVEAIDENSQQ